MKRSLDLVRLILFVLEDEDAPAVKKVVIPGWSDEQVSYHLQILADAGLVAITSTAVLGSFVRHGTYRLTWDGHEFLGLSRKNDNWQRAKAMVEQAETFAYQLLKELLIKFASQQLDL